LWLDQGRADRSWATVAGLLETLATQHPGRREHANATAVDIVAANDVWGRQVPYVVALGLCDGVWPRRPETPLPPTLCRATLVGDGQFARLAPRPQWAYRRQRDQFVKTLQAGTAGVVLTRPTRTPDGVDRPPSPLCYHGDYWSNCFHSYFRQHSLLEGDC
jgi:ATP-dependent helicase/nuclease subunit B